MAELAFSKLLLVINSISTTGQTGCLTLIRSKQQANLFFKEGKLTDANLQPGTIFGEDVLYNLLNWKEGQLAWMPGLTNLYHSLDSQQQEDFYQAVEDLAGLGYFEKSEEARLEVQKALAVTPVTNVNLAAPPPPIQSEPVNSLELPVPAGHLFQLPQPPHDLIHLAIQLKALNFTGYVALAGSGYLVFENGLPGAAFTYRDGKEYRGMEAWQSIYQKKGLPAELSVVSLDTQVVHAWRSLLGTSRPYQNLPATSANFKGLLGTFARSKHSGLIVVCNAQGNFYQFIYQGQDIGIYRAVTGSHELRWSPSGLGDLLDHPQVQLNVYVSRAGEINLPEAIFNPAEINTLAASLVAVIGLVDTLIPNAALTRLKATLHQLEPEFPFLEPLKSQNWPSSGAEQIAGIETWFSGVLTTSREQVTGAFEKLLEVYLQPTCLKIGPSIFHQLVIRALGPELAGNLQKMHLKIDFFDQPVGVAIAAPLSEEPAAIEENPYDF